ncbi:hypothetical protein JCM6882_008166 [Rhodosporidiobolus microsporus]
MAVLLENAIAEELPPPHRPPPSRAESPPPQHDRIPSPPPPPPATDKDKMLAACVGAVLTSLTMTPFDVIKTRLQTAPPPAHSAHPSAFTAPPPSTLPPAHHLPQSHPFSHPTHTPFPPPVASTSTAPPPAAAATAPARGAFFAPNSAAAPPPPPADRSLWTRFDPRVARSSLPASGAHGALSSCAPSASSSSGHAASAALHLSAPSPSSSSSLHIVYPPSSSSSRAPSHPPRPPPTTQPTSFFPLIRHLLAHEGPTALWRGTAPALLMSVPGQVIYMLGYDWGRRTAFEKAPQWARRGGAEAGAGAGALKASYVTAVPLVAGAASRTVVAALLSPFELIRTQLQSHSSHSSLSSPASLTRLLKELHWSTAWRGLGPTLWRDVPFSAVYWAGYEGVKRGLTGGRGMGEAAAAVGGGKETLAERVGLGEFGVAFVSGAGSGMIAATLTNPFDVIKTRRQALTSSSSSSSSSAAAEASTATLSILRQITREEGVGGWFRGLTPRLAKVGPACGLMIGCYEALSSFSSASRARSAAFSSSSLSSSSSSTAE